jgi:hypothetical protein
MDPGVVDTMCWGEDMSPAYDCSATVGILVGLIPAGIDDHLNSIYFVCYSSFRNKTHTTGQHFTGYEAQRRIKNYTSYSKSIF